METKANLDGILNKLKKLKALYESAKKINSENEANVAAAAIQRLLTQYNITMEEVNLEDRGKSDEINEEMASGFTYKSIGGKWEYQLLTVLCNWNFCQCFMFGSTHKNILMFGKKENLETVKWLRGFLSERFVEFSKKRFKEYTTTVDYAVHPMSKDKYQRGYLMGCAAGLNNKLKEEDAIEKAKNETFEAKVTALVVRNGAAITEYIAQKYKTDKGKKSTTKMDSSYTQGFVDGKNTDLHKQVSSGSRAQAAGVGLLG